MAAYSKLIWDNEMVENQVGVQLKIFWELASFTFGAIPIIEIQVVL